MNAKIKLIVALTIIILYCFAQSVRHYFLQDGIPLFIHSLVAFWLILIWYFNVKSYLSDAVDKKN